MTPSLIVLLALMHGTRMYVMPPLDIKVARPTPSPSIPAVLPSRDDLVDKPKLTTPTPAQRAACPKPGTVCLLPWGRAADNQHKVGRIVTTLERDGRSADKPAWEVEMIANLRAKATAEPLIVAAFDREDEESIERHEAIQIWDVKTPPTRTLAMQLALSAENGFSESRGYLVQIVQLGKAGPRVLAEGALHLQ